MYSQLNSVASFSWCYMHSCVNCRDVATVSTYHVRLRSYAWCGCIAYAVWYVAPTAPWLQMIISELHIGLAIVAKWRTPAIGLTVIDLKPPALRTYGDRRSCKPSLCGNFGDNELNHLHAGLMVRIRCNAPALWAYGDDDVIHLHCGLMVTMM